MNIKEMTKLLGLNSTEIKRIESYMEKAEKSEVRYCEVHDREYYDFEFEGMCPIEYEEKLWWDFEHGNEQAGEILRKTGRFEE
jgi:hypothetical protein